MDQSPHLAVRTGPERHTQPDKYSIEGGNPGVFRREGFGKNTMKPGDKVTVYISPLKSGEKGGAINAVMLADGTLVGSHMAMAQAAATP